MVMSLLLLLSTALASPWPELTFPDGVDPAPRDAAVVVGIDRYFAVQDVPGATRNAEDWYRYLTVSRRLAPARVQLMRDGEGTRERVLTALREAATQAGPDGRVWFVFIGHGVPTPDGRDGVLVGVDAQADPETLYPRGILRSEVLSILDDVNAVAVLDTCFSGQSTGGALLPGLQFLVPTWAITTPQTTLLSAGSASEFAGPLPGGARPAFSYLVLGGLLGWADLDGDGKVTSSEAAAYARDTLRATVRGRTQTPEFAGPDQVLSKSAGSRGPNLVEIVVARPPPVRKLASMDATDPMMAELAELHRAQQARIAAERAEAEARTRLEQATQRSLAEAEGRTVARAAEAWRTVEALMRAGGPEARAGAEAFIKEFRDVSVEVAGARRAVRVPEVDRAVAFLEQGDVDARISKVTAPQPPVYRPVPWGLWESTAIEFSERFRSDPARAWDLHQAAWHLPAQISQVCGSRCAEVRVQAENLLVEIATYTAARWDPRFTRISEQDLRYLFLGIREEARDLWYAAAGSEQPLLLAVDFTGFSTDALAEGRADELRAGLIELELWTRRRGASEKCSDKIANATRDLRTRYDQTVAAWQAGDPGAASTLKGIVRGAVREAGRATRCR